MSRFIQQSYQYLNYDSSQEITNILYRAITERNIRAIYFRPFLNKAEYVTDIQAYEDTLKDLGERLKTHNLSYGTVKPYENISTTYFENIFMSLGLLVALLVLMNQIIKTSQTINVALLITGVICISGAYFLAPNLSLQIITLGYSVIIPTLGITMMNKKVKHYSTKKTINTAKLIVPSALQTIKITLISMLGGLLLYGLMAQTSYLVEIDLFRGVKIGQLLPIFLVVVIVLVSFSEQSQGTAKEKINYLKNGFKRLMNVDLKIKYIIILLIVGTVGYIYIARTGHESNIKVSQIEIMIRNFLENTLPVRPRTKEMLIGIPALFLCIYFANRFKYTISSIMVIIATIGQASILNTFQHQRTAMDISITRTLFGLGIGILIGLLYLSIIELGKMALKKIKCSKKKIN